MELLKCPNHENLNSYCMLKTGTKPGPTQGSSFYVCGQCSFSKFTKLSPIQCSVHTEHSVELQSIVLSADHQRRYFRCPGRQSCQSWCGYVKMSSKKAIAALKDNNYRERGINPKAMPAEMKKAFPKPSEQPVKTEVKQECLKPANLPVEGKTSPQDDAVIVVSDDEEGEEERPVNPSAVEKKQTDSSSTMEVSFADLSKSRSASAFSSASQMDVSYNNKSFKQYRESPCPTRKPKQMQQRARSNSEDESSDNDLDESRDARKLLQNMSISDESSSKDEYCTAKEGTTSEELHNDNVTENESVARASDPLHETKRINKQDGDKKTVTKEDMVKEKDTVEPTPVRANSQTSDNTKSETEQQQSSILEDKPKPVTAEKMGAHQELPQTSDVKPKVRTVTENLETLQNRKQAYLNDIQKIQAGVRAVNIQNLPDKGQRILDRLKAAQVNIKEIDEKIRIAKATGVSGHSSQDKGEPHVVRVYPGPNGMTTLHVAKGSSGQTSNHPKVNYLESMMPRAPVPIQPKGVISSSNNNSNTASSQQPTSTQAQQSIAMLPQFMHLPQHLQQLFASNPQAMTLYGGRMTAQRLREVGSITTEAIDKLHKQMETCPTENTEAPDPEGLKVTLMPHQRRALAWLEWREQQDPPGGILADDMGLGKTLTTLSHILRQKLAREEVKKEEWLSRDKEVEKLDKAVKKSRATLIVAPASLVHQWASEIERRLRPGLLKFIVYHGPNRERNIHRLIDNDIVLTTYTIVSKEVGADKTQSAEGPVKDRENPEKNELFDDVKPEDQPMLLRIGWERIVLDEAHNIKNHKSITSMSVCRLRAAYRWALTGTPIQNDLLDMYSLLRFLRFSPFDEYKVWKKHVDSGKGETKKLNTIVKSLLLRRTKDQTCSEGKPLVSLPNRSSKTIQVDLTVEERTVYEKLFRKTQSTVRAYVQRHEDKDLGLGGGRQTLQPQGYNGGAFHSGAAPAHSGGNSAGAVAAAPNSARSSGTTILVLLLRLRQCCSHLSLMKSHLEAESVESDGIELSLEEQLKGMQLDELADDDKTAVLLKSSKLFEKSSVSTKLRCVMDRLCAIRDGSSSKRPEKSVIVSQWTQMLEIVGHHLEKAGIPYCIIQGNIPAKKRMEIVDDFNSNPRGSQVMLLSLRAGGVGLNLIGGNHLFLLDNHWNPALEEQACDRIYRMGQKRDVFIYRFLCKDTIEEKIVSLQEQKLSLAKSVLSGAGAKNQKLTLTDLRLLFGV